MMSRFVVTVLTAVTEVRLTDGTVDLKNSQYSLRYRQLEGSCGRDGKWFEKRVTLFGLIKEKMFGK
jgi:hypothetical protein